MEVDGDRDWGTIKINCLAACPKCLAAPGPCTPRNVNHERGPLGYVDREHADDRAAFAVDGFKNGRHVRTILNLGEVWMGPLGLDRCQLGVKLNFKLHEVFLLPPPPLQWFLYPLRYPALLWSTVCVKTGAPVGRVTTRAGRPSTDSPQDKHLLRTLNRAGSHWV